MMESGGMLYRFHQSLEYVGALIAVSYALCYFWRTPIFILPPEVLQQPVTTIFSRDLDLQTCFSLAYTLGFGFAKPPATIFMTGHFFHTHRLAVLVMLLVSTMLIQDIGILIFPETLSLQILCVFIASFFSSWIYGGVFVYFEGRQRTETLIAMSTFCYILAGTASRATARFVLELGAKAHQMPILIGAVACPISVGLLVLADRAPQARPSSVDVLDRAQRNPVTSSDQRKFMVRFAPGIACLVIPYALLTALRSFRDFYSQVIL
jgi:hypothetical protein